MRRLWSMLVALAVTVPAYAAEKTYDLKPRAIAADTWVIEGTTDNFSQENGGDIVNTAFIVTQTGVIVIDTGSTRRYGEALRAAIARITPQPIALVINTHHHPDHVFGNQAFADVPIAALVHSHELLAEQGAAFSDNLYRLLGDWMRGTEVRLPDQTLTPGVRDIGGHRLRIMALGGHTGADLVLLDETSGVLFPADLVFYQRALTTPQSPGLDRWLADIDTLEQLPFRVLVPGHGPVTTDHRALAQMRAYLTWLDRLLRTSAQAGLDMNEVMQAPIPDEFATISLTRFELVRSVTHLYPRYEAQFFQKLSAH